MRATHLHWSCQPPLECISGIFMADKKQDSGQACGRVQAIAHTMQRRGSVRTFYDNYKLNLGQEITFIVTEEIALTAKIKDV